jgi:hypothetical protein
MQSLIQMYAKYKPMILQSVFEKYCLIIFQPFRITVYGRFYMYCLSISAHVSLYSTVQGSPLMLEINIKAVVSGETPLSLLSFIALLNSPACSSPSYLLVPLDDFNLL